MSIFDKFRHHDDKPQTTEQAPVTPTNTVAPEASADIAPVSSNPAAFELARAADELGGIVAAETQQTGSLDVAAPTAAVEPPTVAEQVAALDAAPTNETSTDATPVAPQEGVADVVPDVSAMSSEDIHQALNIPPVETSGEPTIEAPVTPTTPTASEQPVQNQ